MSWLKLDDVLDVAVDPESAQVQLGSKVYSVRSIQSNRWQARDASGIDAGTFEVIGSEGGGYRVGVASTARARLIGVAWITASSRLA